MHGYQKGDGLHCLTILWKSVGSINCLVTDILQNIFFCV